MRIGLGYLNSDVRLGRGPWERRLQTLGRWIDEAEYDLSRTLRRWGMRR